MILTINQIIRDAVLPIVPICEPHTYDGDDPVYCVYNYTVMPWTYADGAPISVNYATQVHLYLPTNQNPLQIVRSLSLALQHAGFPCPDVQDVSDAISQHYVFEFSHIAYGGDLVIDDVNN